MVMAGTPSPQSVGREFVRQYYTLLNEAPAHLHRFYNNYSSFVHGGLDAPNRETLPVIGQKQIHNRIQQLNFRDCHAKISQVDAQATLGNGVVVQVTGELSNGGAPMRRFTQTFVLAAQSPKKYYVRNDIFRYQDIVFSDEEGEGSGRSEGEEEEGVAAGGYFPPAPNFPAPFPAPPAPPHAPMLEHDLERCFSGRQHQRWVCGARGGGTRARAGSRARARAVASATAQHEKYRLFDFDFDFALVSAAPVLPGGGRRGRRCEVERGGEKDARPRAAASPPAVITPRRLPTAPALPSLAPDRTRVVPGTAPRRRTLSPPVALLAGRHLH
ncbi:jg8433 [Pararge aegeria aegeria]|uniref:Jg8433 protein n=1 Tax=Pararge aegeria aegeria TaxID=348720 RepID=A0A8S4SLC3_9NEOP|nr:jg8433 [Pararge aegeria aegeria]